MNKSLFLFQSPRIFDRSVGVSTNFSNEISLEDPLSLDSEFSSNSSASQQSVEVPNFANISYETLKEMAALSNQDQFIYPN